MEGTSENNIVESKNSLLFYFKMIDQNSDQPREKSINFKLFWSRDTDIMHMLHTEAFNTVNPIQVP